MRSRSLQSRGFSLIEVLIATALSGIVLAAVLAANHELVRSGLRLAQYAEMDAQLRRTFEHFGRDARNANDIVWHSDSDITFEMRASGGLSSSITYAWSAADNAFYSVPGDSSASQTGRLTLVRGVLPGPDGTPGVTFTRFDRDGNVATTDDATKRLQMSLTVGRRAQMTAATTQSAASVSFTLRNKAVQ